MYNTFSIQLNDKKNNIHKFNNTHWSIVKNMIGRNFSKKKKKKKKKKYNF